MDIESIQNICTKLKGVTEDVKWESNLVFSVGGKMFCVVGLNESPTTASFKVKDEDFDEFCNRPGFKPAPYLAKHKWVFIDDINRMKRAEWIKCLIQSHELVAAKLSTKIKQQLGIR